MKTAFAIFALCLVAANAAVVPPVNYEIMVDDILHEMGQIAVSTAHALEHQYEEIVKDPLLQVEASLQSIEERKEESEECVVAQDTAVVSTVDTMHDELNVCGVVAAKTSAVIMNDVNKATQQLVFDGIDVAQTYNKCRNYKNVVLKNSCYARLSIKATLYTVNARRSIKTIRKSTNERIPAVFTDADACTHTASDKAVLELDNVHASIDRCIAKH